jgi:hypothetical protein
MKAVISALALASGSVKPARFTAGVAVEFRYVGFYIEQLILST